MSVSLSVMQKRTLSAVLPEQIANDNLPFQNLIRPTLSSICRQSILKFCNRHGPAEQIAQIRHTAVLFEEIELRFRFDTFRDHVDAEVPGQTDDGLQIPCRHQQSDERDLKGAL